MASRELFEANSTGETVGARTTLFGVLVLVAGPSFGESKENVFVRLYQERVQLAKAETRSQEAETQFQAARVDRYRRLVKSQSISQEEYERAEADYKKSVAHDDVLKARVNEEEAMLEAVKYLVQNGQAVPVCK